MTELKAENKDSDSEEPPRGADGGPAVVSQPQRVAVFPGMDPSALKVTAALPVCMSLLMPCY